MFPNKNIFLSFRKHFHFANVFSIKTISFWKNIFFVSETLLFRKYFVKQIEKNRISFVVVAHAWLRATLRWGRVFPLEKLRASVSTFADSPMSMAPVARDSIARTCRLVWVFLFFLQFWWQQLATGRGLNCASCRGSWTLLPKERCVVNRTPNLPIEMRPLCHWAIAALESFLVIN